MTFARQAELMQDKVRAHDAALHSRFKHVDLIYDYHALSFSATAMVMLIAFADF